MPVLHILIIMSIKYICLNKCSYTEETICFFIVHNGKLAEVSDLIERMRAVNFFFNSMQDEFFSYAFLK